MQVAFYAPMKPPEDPRPSGDRTMARALLSALAAAGVDATVASHLRSRDKEGCPKAQALLFEAAQTEVTRILDQVDRPRWRAWVTYHNYYKAPDLIGPKVAKALNIPYLLIEATRAQKRLSGPWAEFARAAEMASDAADAILYFTSRDAETLHRDATPGQQLKHLRPFLARDALPSQRAGGDGILCVGMMRAGDKLASYKLVAETVKKLGSRTWQLTIVGDGPARQEIERLMMPFGNKVRFAGTLSHDEVQGAYHGADLFLWPGVNEAFGMVYLEAQAKGVPVVAQARPGVREVLAPSAAAPPPDLGSQALAQSVDSLLGDSAVRNRASADARAYVAAHHLRPAAADTLARTLAQVGA
ncbi:MAG: glycosyltransferase family 4 protein [Pseudomonadota bacterium]